MARWRQVYNKETKKSEFIPIDDAARARTSSAYIHGDIQSFVSPVDGSVISDRRQLAEHNKRHGVVSSGEFSQEFYDRKAEERARHLRAENESRKGQVRQEIYNNMIKAEREAGW